MSGLHQKMVLKERNRYEVKCSGTVRCSTTFDWMDEI